MLNQPYRLRILVVLVFCGVTFLALVVRLYWVQIVRHDYYVDMARRHQVGSVPIRPKRGNIYDRNRNPLATSSLLKSLYVNTSRLEDVRISPLNLAYSLAPVLGEPLDTLQKQLRSDGHPPLARLLDPEAADRVESMIHRDSLLTDVLYFERESKRHYPKGRLAGHLLGHVTLDDTGENLGQAGLEYQFNAEIRGNYQKFKVLRDARADQITPIDDTYWSAAFGNELVLTIDESIQHVAEKALRTEIAKYRARCGVVVVQKCRTGEIICAASWPDFDPENYGSAEPDSRPNRVVEHAFGMGSVMKIFTASALIETGRLANLDSLVNCHNGFAIFPPRREPVRDAPGHELGVVPFREAFRISSNIGMVEAAKALDHNAYARILDNFGFGQKTGIDLPGESAGILRPVKQWTAVSMFALPYGGEMSVTPVQLVTAVSAVANGGLLMKPYVVKEVRTFEGRLVRATQPAVRRRVISPVTAGKVLELMEGVVGRAMPDGTWEEGSGKEAAIQGYRVGGKTGTYRWITPGTETTSYTASFVAVLPLPDPELTIFCSVDDPHGEKYGGAVAAPIVRKVAEHSLRILGIPPDWNDKSPTQVQLTLERVRESGNAGAQTPSDGGSSGQAAVARQSAPRGQMPDLTGLTMREVAQCLAGVNVRVSYEGSGVVVAQEPAPLSALRGLAECRVVFGAPDAAGGQPSAGSAAQGADSEQRAASVE